MKKSKKVNVQNLKVWQVLSSMFRIRGERNKEVVLSETFNFGISRESIQQQRGQKKRCVCVCVCVCVKLRFCELRREYSVDLIPTLLHYESAADNNKRIGIDLCGQNCTTSRNDECYEAVSRPKSILGLQY